MKHESWDLVIALLEPIAVRYGTSIYDLRASRTWDTGQAVCAEAYGPDWASSEGFEACDDLPEEEPAPSEFIEAAKRLAGDSFIEWIDDTHVADRRSAHLAVHET